MDLSLVGPIIVALSVAVPAIGAYYSREARKTRRLNRQLQAVLIEFRLHVYRLESELAERGVRPPRRPPLIRAVQNDEPDDEPAEVAPPAGDEGPGEAPGRGPRHAAG